ncbi:MAPEG family protein [Arenimonas composti]|uniref:MAPEG family protein n=1 Tax=Arenimonas composti TR7-09 = DSM 18010 TaxID=1121013 RepID=A0A091BA11_9GAMM|nr:MAPEG family protein [Arenimonas composti]KFN48566.1 hypothetical protein P873_14205 [Arenimonas composti TR7-09 = DSM 18010]
MYPLIGLVTLATVLLLGWTSYLVGRARHRYGVAAPSTTGPDGFQRAFRVQANTFESALMFLPALWTASWCHGMPLLTAALGAVWLIARTAYALTYLDAAKSRAIPFVLSMLAILALVLQAAWGIAWQLVLR